MKSSEEANTMECNSNTCNAKNGVTDQILRIGTWAGRARTYGSEQGRGGGNLPETCTEIDKAHL